MGYWFQQHFIPGFVIVCAGHCIHRDDPLFNTWCSTLCAKGWKVRLALLMCFQIYLKLFMIWMQSNYQRLIPCVCWNFVGIGTEIIGLSIGDECFIMGYTQLSDILDICGKICAWLYLALGWLELFCCKHWFWLLMVILFGKIFHYCTNWRSSNMRYTIAFQTMSHSSEIPSDPVIDMRRLPVSLRA